MPVKPDKALPVETVIDHSRALVGMMDVYVAKLPPIASTGAARNSTRLFISVE